MFTNPPIFCQWTTPRLLRRKPTWVLTIRHTTQQLHYCQVMNLPVDS